MVTLPFLLLNESRVEIVIRANVLLVLGDSNVHAAASRFADLVAYARAVSRGGALIPMLQIEHVGRRTLCCKGQRLQRRCQRLMVKSYIPDEPPRPRSPEALHDTLDCVSFKRSFPSGTGVQARRRQPHIP